MEKRLFLLKAYKKGIKGKYLEMLSELWDIPNDGERYFIKAWDKGMRDKELEMLFELRYNGEQMRIFIKSWKKGMRDDDLIKLVEYGDELSMYAFYKYWKLDMRDIDLERMLEIGKNCVHFPMKSIRVYIKAWKFGMGERYLELLTKMNDHYDTSWFLTAHKKGITDKELEMLFELKNSGTVWLLIRAWVNGIRGEEFKFLVSLKTSSDDVSDYNIRKFIKAWKCGIPNEGLKSLALSGDWKRIEGLALAKELGINQEQFGEFFNRIYYSLNRCPYELDFYTTVRGIGFQDSDFDKLFECADDKQFLEILQSLTVKK